MKLFCVHPQNPFFIFVQKSTSILEIEQNHQSWASNKEDDPVEYCFCPQWSSQKQVSKPHIISPCYQIFSQMISHNNKKDYNNKYLKKNLASDILGGVLPSSS